MTIKSIYYWGLCAVEWQHKYTQYGQEFISGGTVYLLPDSSDDVLSAKGTLANYNSPTTYDDLLKQRDNKWIKFCNEFLPGDTLLFISAREQTAQLACDLEKYDLGRYLKYKSPMAVNRNYPESGHVLQLWILHKD